jgi:hypothetical protein
VRFPVAAVSVLTVALTLPSPVSTQHATMKLGPVLTISAVGSKPGAASGEGYRFVADRGSRKGQAIHVSTTATDGGDTVYQLLSPKTAGPLPDVDVLGMHYVKVRPERRDAFERFVAEKLHPAVANLRPDLRVLYYKSVKGADAGNYVALFALTRASRDKYWPKGADSDALREAFSPAVRELTKELSTYLVDGSYAADPKLAAAVYESREWTDFVLVKE